MDDFTVNNRAALAHIAFAVGQAGVAKAVHQCNQHVTKEIEKLAKKYLGYEDMSSDSSQVTAANMLDFTQGVMAMVQTFAVEHSEQTGRLRKRQVEVIEHYFPELEPKLYDFQFNNMNLDEVPMIKITSIVDDFEKIAHE